MYLKMAKTLRWTWNHSYVLLFIFTLIMTIATMIYFNSIEPIFNYPEKAYQNLENKAIQMSEEFKGLKIPYSGNFETTLESTSPSAKVTLKIYNLGEKNFKVVTERDITSQSQKIFWNTFAFIIIAFLLAVALYNSNFL